MLQLEQCHETKYAERLQRLFDVEQCAKNDIKVLPLQILSLEEEVQSLKMALATPRPGCPPTPHVLPVLIEQVSQTDNLLHTRDLTSPTLLPTPNNQHNLDIHLPSFNPQQYLTPALTIPPSIGLSGEQGGTALLKQYVVPSLL